MWKTWKSIGIAMALLLLVGCQSVQELPIEVPDEAKQVLQEIPDTAEAFLYAKVVEIWENSYLVTDHENAGLYTFSKNTPVYGGEVQAGADIVIGFSGAVMESYPAQLGDVKYLVVTEQGVNTIGLYLDVIADLLASDTIISNGAEDYIFDLTEVENLSVGEKGALVYMTWNKFGIYGRSGTEQELLDEGSILANDFGTKVLFTIKTNEVTEEQFSFEVSMKRNPIGEVRYQDCVATKNGVNYTYSNMKTT